MAESISEWIQEAEFREILFDLEDYGWFHFVFPFLLVYAVVFTILNKVEIFDERKPVKVIIALVFSLFAVAFPISDEGNCGVSGGASYDIGLAGGGCTVGDLMISLFPGVTAFSMGVLALYIVAAMLGVDLTKFLGDSQKDNWIRYVLGFIGLLVVLYYFALGFGWDGFRGSGVQEFFEDPLLYIIIVFGLFFFYVSSDDEESSARERLRDIRRGKDAEDGR